MATGFVEQIGWQESGIESDERLAARARRDADAFGELYRRHVDGIYRYCLRRLGTRELAEDATAQAFEQALRAIGRFRGDSFRAWLFTIARNVSIDLHRRGGHAPGLTEIDVFDPADGPESLVVARDTGDRLRDLLRALPESQRDVIELRLTGLTNDEIGRVIGKRSGAVRMLVHRAFETLRPMLQEQGFDYER